MAPYINYTDISFISLDPTNRDKTVVDMNNKSIININTLKFKAESARFVKFTLGRFLSLNNFQILTGALAPIKFKLWFKRTGIDIYYEKTSEFITSTNLSNIDDIILELEFSQPIPSLLYYRPIITNDIFIIGYNTTHFLWSYSDQTNIVRFSENVPPGTYSIYELNETLYKTRLKNTIFKRNHPLEIDGNYPNFNLNLFNNSNRSVIIYSNSPLFNYFGITINDLLISSNQFIQIPFSYKPYKNNAIRMYYNNTILTDEYQTGSVFFDILDKIPSSNHSNEILIYDENAITSKNKLMANVMFEYDGNIIVEENVKNNSNGNPEAVLFSYIRDISSNNLVSNYGSVTDSIAKDTSCVLLDISNQLYSNTSQYNNVICNNLINTVSTNSKIINVNSITSDNFNSDLITINNGFINIKTKNEFDISYFKYKFIKIDVSGNDYISFNNFKFLTIDNINPRFRVWLPDSNNNYSNITAYDVSFSYSLNVFNVVFEFETPVPRGLIFYFNVNDYGKIFKVNETNNKIYYKTNNNLFSSNETILQATINTSSYSIADLNKILLKKFVGENSLIITTNTGGFTATSSFKATETLSTSITYNIINESTNNVVNGEGNKNINILSDILECSFFTPIISNDKYDQFSNNLNKVILLIKNKVNDISYSLLYDLSNNLTNNSFFSTFFESDISYLTPNDISSGAIDFDTTLLSNLSTYSPWKNLDSDNIIEITDTNSNSNGGNTIAVLLTLKSEFTNNPIINIQYLDDTNTNFNNHNWTDSSFNINYKAKYFLSEKYDDDNNLEYLNFSENSVYYSIPYHHESNNNVLHVPKPTDYRSDPLWDVNRVARGLNPSEGPESVDIFTLKYPIDGPSYDISNMDFNRNTVFVNKNIKANNIETPNITAKNLIGKFNYSAKNIDVSGNAEINKIISYVNNDISNINFSTSNDKTNLAFYLSSTDSIYSGTRMEIGAEPIDSNAGWYIKMISKNNVINSGDAALIFRPKDINNNSNTWFDMSCDLVLSNNAFSNTSDDKYKHNELDISNAINTVMKIQPKYYIKTREMYDNNHILDTSNLPPGSLYESGYIAQELINIEEIKHVVSESSTYKYGVNYDGIQPFLCKAIQELNDEISKLENEIRILENA